jgi:GNAT superfamily N-acetyltransferase
MPECIGPSTATSAPPAVVRAITTVDELREAFALRYEVYAGEGWITREYDSRATRLELDGCDPVSLHLGLFGPAPSRRLLGYVRLITRQSQAVGAALTAAIVAAEGDATLRHAHAAGYPEGLPVFASFPLETLHRELVRRSLTCVELSRLIVREEFRRCGFGARLAGQAFAAAATVGAGVVLVGCGLARVRMFQRLGFALLDTPILNYQRIEQPSRALWRRVEADRRWAGGPP